MARRPWHRTERRRGMRGRAGPAGGRVADDPLKACWRTRARCWTRCRPFFEEEVVPMLERKGEIVDDLSYSELPSGCRTATSSIRRSPARRPGARGRRCPSRRGRRGGAVAAPRRDAGSRDVVGRSPRRLRRHPPAYFGKDEGRRRASGWRSGGAGAIIWGNPPARGSPCICPFPPPCPVTPPKRGARPWGALPEWDLSDLYTAQTRRS